MEKIGTYNEPEKNNFIIPKKKVRLTMKIRFQAVSINKVNGRLLDRKVHSYAKLQVTYI